MKTLTNSEACSGSRIRIADKLFFSDIGGFRYWSIFSGVRTMASEGVYWKDFRK